MVHMVRDSFTNKESVREITFRYDADNPTDMRILEKINSVLDEQPLCTNCINCYKDGYYCGYADWTAREILADIAGMTVNDTINSLTTKIIFGNNKHPIEAFTSPYYDMDGSKCKDYKRK